MQGLHLTADLHGCPIDRPVMSDVNALRALCLAAVAGAGLLPVGELFHRFVPAPNATENSPVGITGRDVSTPVGITGVVLLAESHLAVHTWPELAAATLDVYVCNFGADNSDRAEQLLAALIEAFAPSSLRRHVLQRGGVMRD